MPPLRGIKGMGFFQKLARAVARNDSLLCVGLDPDPERLPLGLPAGQAGADGVAAFQRAIIEATADLVCAYKPNLAFYEALASRACGPCAIRWLPCPPTCPSSATRSAATWPIQPAPTPVPCSIIGASMP